MSRIAPISLKDFATQAPRNKAYFDNPKFISVVKAAACDNGALTLYDGLIRTPEGFFRLALDQANRTLILFASKVADTLKGDVDARDQSIRPTFEGLEKSYCIAAHKLRDGGPLLPPDIAKFFSDKVTAYRDDIQKDSSEKFTLDAIRMENCEFYANKHVAYVIEHGKKGYSVRVIIPPIPEKEPFISKALQSPWMKPLSQQYIIRDTTRALAHHAFAVHSQALTSRLWEYKNIRKGEGLRLKTGKFLSNVWHYPASNILPLAASAVTAGLVTLTHDPKLGMAVLGLISGSHAAFDLVLKGIFSSAAEKVKNMHEFNAHKTLDSFGPDDDCAYYYLLKDSDNIRRPRHHIDPEKCPTENLRFLTFAEMEPLVGKLGAKLESKLRPASFRGLAAFAHLRGNTHIDVLIAPTTRATIHQGGAVVLTRAKSPYEREIYATYRRDACVSGSTHMLQGYIDEAEAGGGIQYINHNIDPERGEQFTDTQIDWAEMKARIQDNLFPRELSTATHFVPTVGPEFQRNSRHYIEGIFAPGQKAAHPELWMGGYNPLLPTIDSMR